MTQPPTFLSFNPLDPAHIDGVTTLWNAAAPAELAISSRFVRYNVTPVLGGEVGGQLAVLDGEIVGAVLVSTVQALPNLLAQPTGWIDLLAVHPVYQRQGIGRTLLLWAERWLTDRNCERIVLGAGLRPFVPGAPTSLQSSGFFQSLGYQQGQTVYDLAANLAGYTPPPTVREIPGVVRPAQPGDEAALARFLAREFPGRWRFEFQEFCRTPNYRISDYMLLWTERGVDGFCCLTFADSHQPIERFYPYTLPRPWGQLGSVGVSADCRGQGYGAAVVDGGLRRLHNNGVNGCVIDWTTIVDFYGKFGFTPYRDYAQLSKTLVSGK
jgi:GNAT superfamily N-acetyltransferase